MGRQWWQEKITSYIVGYCGQTQSGGRFGFRQIGLKKLVLVGYVVVEAWGREGSFVEKSCHSKIR